VTDLNELYQSVILDHNRRPRNYGPPEPGADARSADGKNTLCGDQLTVWVGLDGDTLRDVRFVGQGCAISKASASLMTTAVKGKTVAEAEELFTRFRDLVTGRLDATQAKAALGSLVALGGVARFPQRVKCASMAWHALHAALRGESGERDLSKASD